MTSDERLKRRLLAFQINEVNEAAIYRRLACTVSDRHNSEVLQRIAHEEEEHASVWRNYTGEDVAPSRMKVFFFVCLARLFGLTFGIRLMEKGEDSAQAAYRDISDEIPEAEQIIHDEEEHEQRLIDLIDEERLRYMGSVVLGLNDALVELTGTLAGLTLALQNTRLIALAGLITGVAASLSMSASEYLSRKTEQSDHNPLKASLYTAVAYIATVAVLIIPFLVVDSYLVALACTLINAVLIILIFTFYISVAQNLSFTRRFLEMVVISLGVAGISFAIGMVIRSVLGIEV